MDPKATTYSFQTPYAYAANNPVKFTASNGENPLLVILLGVAIISTFGAKDAVAPTGNPEQDAKGLEQSKDTRDAAWAVATPLILSPLFRTNSGQEETGENKEKTVPNPDGKKGGVQHQKKSEEVGNEMERRGLIVEDEYKVNTPEGEKNYRYVDKVGKDPKTGEVVEQHQVGRQNKDGTPVKRERTAKRDIEDATGKPVRFHPYNK